MVVRHHDEAVASAGLRTSWDSDAKKQALDMGDLLLHETAVAWFGANMRRETPDVLPWHETRAQWARRAARCVRQINHDVAGLCREFLARLLACREREGDRLPK